jgi:methyl-accepting chemotaxis protein
MATAEKNGAKFHSVSLKIDLALGGLFLLILLVSSLYLYSSQTTMVEQLVEDQTKNMADSYFDSINTLMLTGGMANREIPRQKLISKEEVLDARIIRGDGIKKYFGDGDENAQPKDDLDRKALGGELIHLLKETEDGRVLTIIEPMKALKDYRGTNCLLCHVVPEGEVLGAVRIDYSLKKLDATINRDLMTNILINMSLLIIGLLFISFAMKKLVTRPLKKITDTIQTIDQESNLKLRVNIKSRDELGEVATAINHMMETFDQMIAKVVSSILRLSNQSQHLASITEQSIQGAQRQQEETQLVATAMTEMEQTSATVADHAANTALSTQEADKQAAAGEDVVKKTIDSITELASNVSNASEEINHLEAESENIGRVVDVITNIAEQTNLLALNAAIEAARAGEQGRGFAVVADEVRTLATRTHKATQEIQSMIENLQSRARQTASVIRSSSETAEASVADATLAGNALYEITYAVGNIKNMNDQIASAAGEQRAVSEEMSRNVVSINNVATDTVEISQKIAQASDELADLAQNLEQIIRRFKT